MYLRDKEGRVRSLDREARRVCELPMHGGRKELGTGLVNAIKKQLGLK
jgi:mRNA interferase HicA